MFIEQSSGYVYQEKTSWICLPQGVISNRNWIIDLGMPYYFLMIEFFCQLGKLALFLRKYEIDMLHGIGLLICKA